MALEKGIYNYTTYNNLQINAVAFSKENLEEDALKTYEYLDTPTIYMQN